MSNDENDYGNAVIATAELLHGNAKGTRDGHQYDELDKYADWLDKRVNNYWQEPSDSYDLAVRIMAIEAVEMWKKFRQKFGTARLI